VSEPVETPRIRFERDALHIEFPSLFGPGGEAQARRFVRRVFAFPEVGAVRLQAGQASVYHQAGEAGRKDFIGRLAGAIGGREEGLDEALLPAWAAGEPVALHRFGPLVSTFDIAQTGPGRLQLRHAAIGQSPALARRLEEAAKTFAGVKQATATGSTGRLWVVYSPQAVDVSALIRALEAQLASPRTALATVDAANPAKLGLANATLGLAALGEFAVPVVLPVCVGMLVVSNFGTIRDAGRQLGKGKVGLPVLYTALLGCSITTGQIVAHALMEWSFRFWERRSNNLLAEECRALLEDTLPVPAEARQVRSDEVEALVPSDSLQPGDRIRIAAPAAIPADGRVVGGGGLAEQGAAGGDRLPRRLGFGDEVLAGATLLAGQVEVEVLRAGPRTQAAQIARQVIDGARGLHFDPALRRRAQSMADRAVPPTLALAALGWTVGGLFTVGAVLHQDHASGPLLALPLETLRDMGEALRGGVVVRRGGALPRLAESRFFVLDDHPAWAAPGLELETLRSRLAESETDNLLRYVAGAGLYLGDARAEALAEACRVRGLVVRRPPVTALAPDKLTVRQGAHTVSLQDLPVRGKAAPALRVEIDGEEVGLLEFRESAQPRAALAVRRLRERGAQVFLLSGRPAGETAELAARLGADLHGGDFSPEEKQRFLQGLARRGVSAAYVGEGPLDPALAGAAHVAVSFGAAGLDAEAADLVVLGDSLDALAEVAELADTHQARAQAICRRAMAPNLLCIVGGYAGLLNGITSGLIANLGVNRVYRQAAKSLRDGGQSGFKRI
jgi:cation transport ATPase